MATKSRTAKARGSQTETQAAVSGIADRLQAIVGNINKQRADHREQEAAADKLREEGHAVEPKREVIHLSKQDTLTFLACDLRAGLVRANARASTINYLLCGKGEEAVVAAPDECTPGLSDLLIECSGLLGCLNTRLCLIEGRI
jgi:hypothetical protein